MTVKTSLQYEIFNDSSNKPLIYVLTIEDVPYVFTSSELSQRIKYGDPGVNYGGSYNGQPLVYSGLIPYGGILTGAVDPNSQKDYLDLSKSGMTISQKVEPWEGKSSVSLLDFVLTDVNQEVLALISPSVELPEILLKRVEFYVGFETLGFPEEYIRLYRGLISGVEYMAGSVTIKTSDPNLLRRQKLFEKSSTHLTSGINASATTINVVSTDGFYELINAPGSLSPETGHQVGIKIDDEIITYTAAPGATSFTGVVRGAFGTTASIHQNDAEVTPIFQFEGNPLRTACKLMLSGWGGMHSVEDVSVRSFVNTGDGSTPTVQNSVIFGVDLKDKYGLFENDYITVSGSGSGNNFTERKIVSFFDVSGIENSGIVVDGSALTPEGTTSALASFRSQFDVYPEKCGVKMKMIDVDVDRHITTADQFVIDEVAYFDFVNVDEENSAKGFIEKELYVPIGGFSLTRAGRCSVVITAPPLPSTTVLTLNSDTVIDADKAKMERSVTTRKFYNRIDFSYNYDVAEGDYLSFIKYIDSDSIEKIPYVEVIQIESRGMHDADNASALIDRTQRRLFERYSFAAQTINFKTIWQVGALLEAGDVVLVDDQGGLNFPDLSTGQRGLPLQLWEVLEKSTDLKTGVTTLTIINGLGTQVTDRYGVIAPSSLIDSGLSTSQFRLEQDSYGALFPLREYKKWEDYVGLNVIIHNDDYSVSGETVLTEIDNADKFLFTVDPPLSFVPSSGYTIDLAPYSVSADPTDQQLAKINHAFLSPVVDVVSGASNTQFDVAALDVSKFWIGGVVVVHSSDYTTLSPEVFVTNISGTTITVGSSLGFTPSAGQKVTFIGFSADSSQTYRLYG